MNGARGATVHAKLPGYGTSVDAHHMTSPSAQGQCAAIRNTLRGFRSRGAARQRTGGLLGSVEYSGDVLGQWRI